jgi:hypothetical protein
MFLLCILPLQYCWSAATVHCQHGQQKLPHAGQHHDLHEAPSGDSVIQGTWSADHNDCGDCQLSCQTSLPVEWSYTFLAPGILAQPALQALSFSSHIPDAPRRPDWRFVA